MIDGMVALLVVRATFHMVGATATVPFTRLDDGTLAVPVRVGEIAPRPFALALGQARSAMQIAKGASAPLPISIGGLALGRLALDRASASAEQPDVSGTLGIDVLKTMALGFDLASDEVTVWAKGCLARTEGEAWVRGANPQTGVRRADLANLPLGRPGVSLNLGSRTVPLLLVAGMVNSVILRKTALSSAGGDRSSRSGNALSLAKVGDADLGWLSYLVLPASVEATVGGRFARAGAVGSLSLDAFASRRVLVDFAGHVVYSERLGKDEQASLFLERQASAPLSVSGYRIVLRSFSSPDRTEGFAEYAGSDVVRIAGVPTASWLAALGGSDADALAKLLELTQKSYTLTIRDANGDERDLAIKAGA